jgi:F-type H+-transporting ATPase subunit epsilon
MADKLYFSLVTPEREVFSGEVDQVVAPGVEGDFGVLAGHTPFMTVLKLGDVVVLNGTERRVFEIQGGFADVTPQGLIILAEHALEYGLGVHDDGHGRRPEGVGPTH